ncbi:50S ribosomal protein L23 [Candidatus Woesearchaeota archaeon]|nr:50S ribosomal protein L23 [Candidatus Woesearchaeota archaeon]
MAEEKKQSNEFDAFKVINYPLSTEKAVRLMESENKLLFVVDRKAKKADVKKAVEEIFKCNVIGVNIFITPKGEKRAYVKFSPDKPAIDIATELGLI